MASGGPRAEKIQAGVHARAASQATQRIRWARNRKRSTSTRCGIRDGGVQEGRCVDVGEERRARSLRKHYLVCDSFSVIRFRRYDLSSCCLSPRIAELWGEPSDIEGQSEHSTRCAVVVGGVETRGDGIRRKQERGWRMMEKGEA